MKKGEKNSEEYKKKQKNRIEKEIEVLACQGKFLRPPFQLSISQCRVCFKKKKKVCGYLPS